MKISTHFKVCTQVLYTHCWSQHKRSMAGRMPIELKWKGQRWIRFIVQRTFYYAISGLPHSPFTILRSSGRHRNIRLTQLEINFTAVVQPSANMHCAVLRIEWPSSIVGTTEGLMQTWRNTWNGSIVIDQAARSFAELIFGWSNIAVENS